MLCQFAVHSAVRNPHRGWFCLTFAAACALAGPGVHAQTGDGVDQLQIEDLLKLTVNGSNAFFGVLNVITRHADAKPGVSAAAKFDSQHRNLGWAGLVTRLGEDSKLSM